MYQKTELFALFMSWIPDEERKISLQLDDKFSFCIFQFSEFSTLSTRETPLESSLAVLVLRYLPAATTVRWRI